MKAFINDLNLVLNNENGSPHIEELMGISAALVVGVGLFFFGRSIYNWYNGSAGNTVKKIGVPGPGDYEREEWFN